VPARFRTTLWTLIIVSAASGCLAQYQDRDRFGAASTSSTAPAPEKRLDVNHATVAELEKIPGLTHPWAERIVRFRPYRTKLDLVEKGILSNAVYDRIKDFVIAHHEPN
jgi:DNA uptake protein ComE-like DNA-binding protein